MPDTQHGPEAAVACREAAEAADLAETRPEAGHRAPVEPLTDVSQLVLAYRRDQPDPAVPAQRVVFGTSGHRGSALDRLSNEWHVPAITQAICDHHRRTGICGPLFMGIDTHALSAPAFAGALEVLAGNGVDVMLAAEITARPSGTEALYRLYAESFGDAAHLQTLLHEAQALVDLTIRAA